jgi:nitrate reductase alpha subunit
MGRQHDRLQRARRAHGLAAFRAAAAAPIRWRLRRDAQAAGMEPKDYVGAARSRRSLLEMSARTRIIRTTGRATCSSGAPTCSARAARGTSISSSICSAPAHGVQGKDLGRRPTEAEGGGLARQAPKGKLDLLVTLDFRMSTTCVYSDIVCRPPPGTRRTISTPATCTRSSTRCRRRSIRCGNRAATGKSTRASRRNSAKCRAGSARRRAGCGADADPCTTRPANSRRPSTSRTGNGRGRTDPGQDHARRSAVVERDYPNVYKRFTALGPLMDKLGNGGKGIAWNTEHEVENLSAQRRGGRRPTQGMPRIETASTPPRWC